jgi:tetratricopeptide (TPR) repeat protein
LRVFSVLFFGVLLSAAVPFDLQDDGLKALDQQNYQQAQQIFAKLAAQDPKDYSALFNLALAEIGLKQDSQAADHLKQVLVLKPGLYEADLNLGILQLRNHHAADAIPVLRDAVKQKPNAARAQKYLGDALLASEDAPGATEAYRAALAADPMLANAELALGQSLLKQKQVAEAAPHYRKAADLDPRLKNYLLEIASALLQANEREKAIDFLKEFPDNPDARKELGRIYLADNRPADAVPEFQSAVNLAPSAANQLALASALLSNKQDDAAKPLLERAVSQEPRNYDLRMIVGRIHRDKHEYIPAANEFLAAASLKPDSVEAWNEAVGVLVPAAQYPQALACLDKVHNLNADTAGDFYYRAIVLDKLRQVKPALASYRRFLEMSQGKNPDQEFIARQRSRILEKEANR